MPRQDRAELVGEAFESGTLARHVTFEFVIENDGGNRREQAEFWRLLKKSKGRLGTLSQRDRTRIKNIAGKAVRG